MPAQPKTILFLSGLLTLFIVPASLILLIVEAQVPRYRPLGLL